MQTPDMTYYQWLIGQALSGIEASNFENSEQESMSIKTVATRAIDLADEVCRQLDERSSTPEG